jgi:hypothetical protein
MREAVKKEILKLLHARIIYPIPHSEWVSPVQVVPKKGGMTVVKNDKNELISQRTITGWRIYIDYRKLNKATKKDHFPLPFIDEMLERLANHSFFYFLIVIRDITKFQSTLMIKANPLLHVHTEPIVGISYAAPARLSSLTRRKKCGCTYNHGTYKI